jgi:CDP-glucose 4,6-dehydratase
VENLEMNPQFWRNRKVLITGHTGFKGSWLSLWLQSLGAELVGYSLPPPGQPSLFELANVGQEMQSIHGDLLDLQHLRCVTAEHRPEIVFHLAAQSLVRRSYADPIGTYATNVLGTAHALEAIREVSSVRAVVVATSDKCYDNRNGVRAYRESDMLGGADPYSSSKASAELVTAAFRDAFYSARKNGASTGIGSARAGNVIGGGDWGEDRLIPDVMRALFEGRDVLIRNPQAIRPWQHVLDTLSGYLVLAEKLCNEPQNYAEAWNFGPHDSESLPVSAVLERLSAMWGPGVTWKVDTSAQPWEAPHLKLDSSKAESRLGWQPRWNLNRALQVTVEWYKAQQAHEDLRKLTLKQIQCHQDGSAATQRQ